MSDKALTISQVAVLANMSEGDVKKAMRRKMLPSLDCNIVRDWLAGLWRKDMKRMIREEFSRE